MLSSSVAALLDVPYPQLGMLTVPLCLLSSPVALFVVVVAAAAVLCVGQAQRQLLQAQALLLLAVSANCLVYHTCESNCAQAFSTC